MYRRAFVILAAVLCACSDPNEPTRHLCTDSMAEVLAERGEPDNILESNSDFWDTRAEEWTYHLDSGDQIIRFDWGEGWTECVVTYHAPA